jgi:hypothetical protein
MSEKKTGLQLDPEFLKSLSYMKNNLVAFSEFIVIQAQLHREKYDACLNQGFTKQQALELCKNIFSK